MKYFEVSSHFLYYFKSRKCHAFMSMHCRTYFISHPKYFRPHLQFTSHICTQTALKINFQVSFYCSNGQTERGHGSFLASFSKKCFS